MNKLNILKLTSITASVALLLSVVFSGSALAGPGKKKGPQGSIGVTNICELKPNNLYDATLEVTTTIVDKSSGAGEAVITSFSIQAKEKYGGRVLNSIGDAQESTPILPADDKVVVNSSLNLCVAGAYPGLNPDDAKAVNAETTVWITDGHKASGWISRCVDDPSTDDINELQSLKIGDLALCPQNSTP